MSNNSTLDVIVGDLIEQKNLIENTIEQLQALSSGNFTIKKKTLPRSNYIIKKYIINDIDDAYLKVEEFLEEVLTKSKINIPLIFIEIEKEELDFKGLEINVGIEVVHTTLDSIEKEEEEVLELYHKGKYEDIIYSHKKLREYALENNVKLKGNIIHFFYESYNFRNNPNNYITRIVMPIKEE